MRRYRSRSARFPIDNHYLNRIVTYRGGRRL